jgi:hypothetical protein
MELNQKQIESCARAAHEVNRAYCIAIGDDSQVPWEDAAQWQRESAIHGVQTALGGSSPEEQHRAWLADKVAAGWKYGPAKDAEKKEHPCMVDYSKLPPEQRRKDLLYTSVVPMMALALLVVA